MMVYRDKNIVVIEKKCPFCGQVMTITIPTDKYIKWHEGELIQNAMPNLSPAGREVLISGICLDCQDNVFGTEDDE